VRQVGVLGVACAVALSFACGRSSRKPRAPLEEVPFVLSPSKPLPAGGGGEAALAVTHATPITFLAGSDRAAAVRGTVRGKSTWFFLDTGAHVHCVELWLARKLLQGEQEMSMSQGPNTFVGARMDRPSLAIEGWGPIPDSPVMVLSKGLGPGMEAADIGLILAPQKLSPDEAVVLDFPGRTLELMAYDSAEMGFASRGARLVGAGGHRCYDRYVIPASIEGRSVSLYLDTGDAFGTTLWAGSSAARALAMRTSPEGHAYTVVGPRDSRAFANVDVRVGDWKGRLDIHVGETIDPTDPCRVDGLLGMDVLKDCVVVLAGERFFARCG
jgi:hypothetical protein